MSASTFALVVIGVLLNAAAQLLLKAGTRVLGVIELRAGALADVAMQPYILGGLTCYVLSVAIWIAALSRVEVSIAYPMLSLGYIVNALAAWFLFGEALTPSKIVGIGVILAGVVILARG